MQIARTLPHSWRLALGAVICLAGALALLGDIAGEVRAFCEQALWQAGQGA